MTKNILISFKGKLLSSKRVVIRIYLNILINSYLVSFIEYMFLNSLRRFLKLCFFNANKDNLEKSLLTMWRCRSLNGLYLVPHLVTCLYGCFLQAFYPPMESSRILSRWAAYSFIRAARKSLHLDGSICSPEESCTDSLRVFKL